MSAWSIPCFTRISLVAMARPTSKMTMPTSYGAKSNFSVAPFVIFFLPSAAYRRPLPCSESWSLVLMSSHSAYLFVRYSPTLTSASPRS